jgi:hypothetical protein
MERILTLSHCISVDYNNVESQLKLISENGFEVVKKLHSQLHQNMTNEKVINVEIGYGLNRACYLTLCTKDLFTNIDFFSNM